MSKKEKHTFDWRKYSKIAQKAPQTDANTDLSNHPSKNQWKKAKE